MRLIKVCLVLIVVGELLGGLAFFEGAKQTREIGPLHYGIIVEPPEPHSPSGFWVDLYHGTATSLSGGDPSIGIGPMSHSYLVSSTPCRQDMFVWGPDPQGGHWTNGTVVEFYWTSSFYGLVRYWTLQNMGDGPLATYPYGWIVTSNSTIGVTSAAVCYDGSDPF